MTVTDMQLQRLERLAEAAAEVVKRFRLYKETMTRQDVRVLGDLDAATLHARLSISQIQQSNRRAPEPTPPEPQV
jgi:hypothetical protein